MSNTPTTRPQKKTLAKVWIIKRPYELQVNAKKKMSCSPWIEPFFVSPLLVDKFFIATRHWVRCLKCPIRSNDTVINIAAHYWRILNANSVECIERIVVYKIGRTVLHLFFLFNSKPAAATMLVWQWLQEITIRSIRDVKWRSRRQIVGITILKTLW